MNKHEEAREMVMKINETHYEPLRSEQRKPLLDYIAEAEAAEKELAELKKIIMKLAYHEKSDNDFHVDRFQYALVELVDKGDEYRKLSKVGKE